MQNANVQAFLAMIRRFESNGDYNVLYGGGHFQDMSHHPDVHVPFYNPATGKDDYSTAAGAYQFNYPTWLEVQTVAALPDFSQSSQDIAAVWLLKIRGVLPDILAGNFDKALQSASRIWASLPGSTAGQNPQSYASAYNAYTGDGGTVA